MHDGSYRPKGSSNPDAVLGSTKGPDAVFDVKTGKSGMSKAQKNKYGKNLPEGTGVYTVTPKGHNVPKPKRPAPGTGAATGAAVKSTQDK
jgi:hypothetical protein